MIQQTQNNVLHNLCILSPKIGLSQEKLEIRNIYLFLC